MQIHTTISSFINKHLFSIGVFGILFGFTFISGSFVVANGQTIAPSDSHIVSLYVNDEETIIPTRAKTVGELIEKVNATKTEADLVEPALDTAIDSDNFRINVYKARPVTIIDEGEVIRTLSPHKDAKLVAEKAGLKVYKEDILTSSTGDSFIEEKIIGEKITIERATPVSVSLFGAKPLPYRTHVNTVGELLAEKELTVEEGAVLSPAANTKLTPNLLIYISKFGKKVVTEDVNIPFNTQSTNDPKKPIGFVSVTKAGSNGLKKVTYEIDTQDGREVGRKILQEVVVDEPVTQVQTKGTQPPSIPAGNYIDWMDQVGIAPSDRFYVDYIVRHEAGWGGVTRWNTAGSGAYGICQALPASKMASAGADYMTNPVTQLKWCDGYAKGRYGSWKAAYDFKIRTGWW